tara:strand:- start:66 stop:632 length:567 start_codon:yes stop_codon:yes gene_type:complete
MAKKSKYNKLSNDLKNEIRLLFVQGFDDDSGNRKTYTLEELALKFNIAKSTLYRNAQQDDWKMQREQFQQEYMYELDTQRKKDLTEESKRFDTNSINLAKALLTTVGQNLAKNNQELNEGKKGLIPTQLNALANAALSAQRLAKLALGEVTHNVEINGSIQNNAFREAMELLDTVADGRRKGDDKAIH